MCEYIIIKGDLEASMCNDFTMSGWKSLDCRPKGKKKDGFHYYALFYTINMAVELLSLKSRILMQSEMGSFQQSRAHVSYSTAVISE